MSLKSCEKAETNVYALEIGMEGEAFKAAVVKAYNKNKSKYNVPGFRKGKAPKHVIETYYGKEVFLYDAVDAEYGNIFEEAVKEAGIVPVSAPFEDKLAEINEDGFTVTLKVYVKPEADVKKYKGISAEKDKVSVKKAEVTEEVNRALEKDAKMVTVEDKPVEKGNTANIDFEGFIDGVAFEGGKGENHDLEIGSGTFIPGFEDQIIGHKTGDEFDVNVTFPEEYGAEELAGKEAVFKVKVNKIMKKELPVYDDEFVKDVSEFDTVADYEKNLEKEIKVRKQAAADRKFENDILDALVENTEVEIPDCMVEKEIDNQLNEFNYRLSMQGMNLDMYMKYTGMDEKAFRDTYKDGAVNSIKLRLALEKIIALENIEVTDEEIEAELKSYSESYGMEIDKIKELVQLDDVKADLGCRKAMDLVKSEAVEAKKKTTKKAAEDESEEKKPAKKSPAKKKPASDGEEKAEKKTPAKKAKKPDAE